MAGTLRCGRSRLDSSRTSNSTANDTIIAPMSTPANSKRLTKRSAFALVVHAAVFCLCYWLAFGFRFDFAFTSKIREVFWISLPAVLLTKLVIFYAMGHCHVSWRYVTFSDLALLLKASFLSLVAIATIDYFLVDGLHSNRVYAPMHIPRGIPPMDFILTVMFLGGLRALWRLSREEVIPLFNKKGYHEAFIVGANHAGESLARQLQSDPRLKYTICGFLDSDPVRHGSMLSGVPVLGYPRDVARYAVGREIQDVLVVSGAMSGKEIRQLMDRCEAAGITVKVLPSVDELLNSNYQIQIRDVNITDLLRRDPVELNSEAIGHLLEGKTVMVTGAGGSIGSEVCRQVLRFSPKSLLLVERAENSLFTIEQELGRLAISSELHPCVADISDSQRLDQILSQHRPDVIFHAAAHKHVPMMESNPGEAIKNNVVGTKLLAEAADRHEVQRFVMISTDKAVNPTSIMGVSKQIAERFVQSFAAYAKTTKYVVVRFGNVLGSAGSVVPTFKAQIRRGGPVTVTHEKMERFFMTIPEASQLVLQAAAMGTGGEIFVLDMGEPVKIVDLARDLIHLSGLSEDDIDIVFTGLRPGEKLYEELYFDEEEMLATDHPKLFAAYHRPYEMTEVRQAIDELCSLAHGPAEALRHRLKHFVPEYQLNVPTSTVKKAPKQEPAKDESFLNTSVAES